MHLPLERRRWLQQLGVLAMVSSGGLCHLLGDLQPACLGQVLDPVAAQWDLAAFAETEPLIDAAIAAGEMPGCVVCMGSHSQVAWLKAYGDRQVEPSREAMTVDTIFDLASLTKPVVTATCVMALLEQGKLKLDDPIGKFIPEFAANGKSDVTVEDLLVHRSGLIPDNPLSDYLQGPDRAWAKIWELKLNAPRGSRFQYSDVNFLVLGKLIERVSGQTLDRFAKQFIFDPLAMSDTGYGPAVELQPRIAPTAQQHGQWLRGTVHDPRAAALGGVAGHAGLFSTATDLAIYSQALLQLYGDAAKVSDPDGRNGPSGASHHRGQTPLPKSKLPFGYDTFQLMNQPVQIGKEFRGLGWDKASSFSTNGGTGRSESAFGHGGFTGTVLWIDPEQDWFFIFLSNRLHPDGRGAVNTLAGKIATSVAKTRVPLPLKP